MEVESEGRVKSLPYKVRAASRESPAQRASQLLDTDLRTHWSTSTNTKEWILLELEESCLLSHIRIHNKAVLEWEISIGLRNKPETFLKVRPRCEAPRRDITYNIGHLPCRFVRISCLRGNPIAIFFVQLMGISVPGLEPELQPVVEHLLPQIISHMRDPHDIQLQLLQDISIRLSPFFQQLEGELSVSSEAMDHTIRFLAMLVGPFYPFLALFGAVRESEKVAASGGADTDLGKSSLASVFTVSSNFQAPPKRVRSPGLALQPTGHSLALRPDGVLLLLKVAYKDNYLASVCRKVARVLRKLAGLRTEGGPASIETGAEDSTGVADTAALQSADFSSLFGEDFRVDDDSLEIGSASTMDVPSVEEGLLHLLYACATQPIICRRLADAKSDFSPVLPILQALLPALRPPFSTAANAYHVDETFWQWQTPLVQRALTQVVALATAPSYRPLLDACAGYLSAYSPAHEKSACVLIDLCAGPLAPWLSMIIVKIDLALELLEDLLGIIQAGQHAPSQARAVLVYMMLGLSGHVDDVLPQYKKVKHKLLFLIEMLEPYLIPAIMPVKSTIAFGDVSGVVLEKHEQTCALALDLLHSALQKPTVLPAMEAEWRRGHVAPSVLLSILAPHVALPPGIDIQRSSMEKGVTADTTTTPDDETIRNFGTIAEEASAVPTSAEGASKVESNEDATLLFAPLKLKSLTLLSQASHSEETLQEDEMFLNVMAKMEGAPVKKLLLDVGSNEHDWDLQTEYWQLVNTPEREVRASEFMRFAAELHSRQDVTTESQQSAIDALLLAAECHLNPFFMISSSEYQQMVKKVRGAVLVEINKASSTETPGLDMLAWLEEERDKTVLNILMHAAKWDVEEVLNRTVKNTEGEDNEDLYGGSCHIEISEADEKAEDAVTLVRQQQGLLCQFLIRQLQQERHNLYEVLLQGLLFVLHSATQLSSTPEDVIDVILECAARLNASLISYPKQGPKGSLRQQGSGTFHSVRRQWVLLRKLALAASGGRLPEDESEFFLPFGSTLRRDLIPAWAWMSKIPQFASSTFPLVRYVGWMAVARFAQFHIKMGLPLVSDIQDLTTLLRIFSDDIVSLELLKCKESGNDDQATKAALEAASGSSIEEVEQADPGNLVRVVYPETARVFPRLRAEFSHFAETLLQSICLQIEAVPVTVVPDMMSWFCEVCYQPFPALVEGEKQVLEIKGFVVANVRYVIMRLLEVIIVEHMEAILPELPRIFQVLVSLCSSSYCDVPLMEGVLKALKPIISHVTSNAAATEEDSSIEVQCYETLMQLLIKSSEEKDQERVFNMALCLFLCGSFLSVLSTPRCNSVLTSLKSWVDSTIFSSIATCSLYDTLRALQTILDECFLLLKEMGGERSVLAIKEGSLNPTQGLCALAETPTAPISGTPESEESDVEHSGVVKDRTSGKEEMNVSGQGDTDSKDTDSILEDNGSDEKCDTSHPRQAHLTKFLADKIEFRDKVRELILALGPTLEGSRKMHPQLTSRVTQVAAQCLYYSGYRQDELANNDTLEQCLLPSVKTLAQSVRALQNAHCWQVASTTMDYLLSLPSIVEAFTEVCMIIEFQCTHAPRIAWRLLATQWLPKALGVESLPEALDQLIHLLSTMIELPEPEHRMGVMEQLGKMVNNQENKLQSKKEEKEGNWKEQQTFVEILVSAMWLKIVTAATSEASAELRGQALEVLIKMVPLAEPMQLQSLLSSMDLVLKTGPLTLLGLSLLARACLYSDPSDIDIIPSRVWTNIQALAQSKPGGKFVEMEREICQALLRLREEGETAKQHTREVLLRTPEKPQPSPSFASVREAVLEVLARLSVMRSKADISSATAVNEAAELEEAKIEMELLREERVALRGNRESVFSPLIGTSPAGASTKSTKTQLMQLRAQILAEELSAARAEVAARREKQRIVRRERQLALEKTTIRQMELLQELDRERAAEAERDIERQRTLETERTKTRELRHTLDLEAERRAQRDYQRELEQRETGAARASRREFASNTTPSSRPRERYREREREIQRSGQEGPSRPSSDSGGARESATTPPATPTAGNTPSAMAVPTVASIVTPSISNSQQSRLYSLSSGLGRDNNRDRDRSDERGYEEVGEGNGTTRDTGEGSSFNDGDGALSMDGGPSGSAGSSHKQGPRSSRLRPNVERRERDVRREGKWERKQS